MPRETARTILKLLKAEPDLTAQEVASRLGLARSSVREQFEHLEAEGWIEARTRKQPVGRPQKIYRLAPDGHALFPRRYDELLDLLVAQIKEQQGSACLCQFLDAIAMRWADGMAPGLEGLDPEARLVAITEQLDFGGMMPDLETTRDGYVLNIHNCLYSSTAQVHSEICRMLPAMLSRLTGLPTEVKQRVFEEGTCCAYTIGAPPS